MQRLVFASVGLIGLCSSTFAQPVESRNQMRDACASDYRRLCASVSPGGGRIRTCMKEHFDKLSEACKIAVQEKLAK